MKSELAAGDSTWIELIYTAGGAKSRTHKSARVTTNDTTLGSVSIAFKAETKEPGDSALLEIQAHRTAGEGDRRKRHGQERYKG